MGVIQYQIKAGRRYQAQLYQGGKRVATQGGFLTKKAARKWLADKEENLTAEKESLVVTGFIDIAEAYLDYSSTHHKPNTYMYKKGVIKKFIHFIGLDCPAVNKNQVKQFLLFYRDKISPKTANKYKVELSGLFNWAIKEEHIDKSPVSNIERFAETQYRRYIPSSRDLEAVIKVAKGWQKDFINLLLHTAARQNELMSLTWEDISFRLETITLWTSKRRGGNRESRILGMTPAAKDILLRRKKEGNNIYVFVNPHTNTCYTRQSRAIKNLFLDLCREAQVKHFSAHSIRHFIASTLVEREHADVRTVQKILGHKNISTTEGYLQELEVDRSVTKTLNSVATFTGSHIESHIEPL